MVEVNENPAQEARKWREAARFLESKIADSQMKLANAKQQMEAAENKCQHDWTEPKWTGKTIPGYTSPGDPPGTMGVDWRGPVSVPSETINEWTRTCKKCGKEQKTDRTSTVTRTVPQF